MSWVYMVVNPLCGVGVMGGGGNPSLQINLHVLMLANHMHCDR